MKATAGALVLVAFYAVVACSPHTEYTIGVIAPLSGPQAFIGQDFRDGALLAAGDNNLVFEDSRGENAGAVTAYHLLLAKYEIDGLIVVSSGDEAVLLLAEQDRIPTVLTVSSASGLPARGKYIFRYFTNADVDAPVMAEYAAGAAHRIGILYVQDAFGQSYADRFAEEIQRRGGNVVANETFTYTDQEYRAQLLKLKEANIDGLYIVGLDYQIAEALKEMRQLDINVTLFSVGTIATAYGIDLAGDTAEGLVVTAFCTDGAPETYTTLFESNYNRKPGFFSELGYDIVGFFDEANGDGSATMEEVVDGLLRIQDQEANAGTISSDENGELVIPMCPKRIQNGRIFNLKTERYSDY